MGGLGWGWTLILSAIFDKFTSREHTAPDPTSREHTTSCMGLDINLINSNQGDNEDQGYLVEDFANEENFLEDNIPFEAQEDLLQVVSALVQQFDQILDSGEVEIDLDATG